MKEAGSRIKLKNIRLFEEMESRSNKSFDCFYIYIPA